MDTLVQPCVNSSSRRLFWFRFIGKHCFTSSSTDFSIPAHFRCQDSVRGRGGSFLGMDDSCLDIVGLLFTSVVSWFRADCSFLCFFLFACGMARDQEETSTSQAGRKRGPTWGTPSTSSIISSLSMEELRAYYEIPNNIDVMLSDGPARNTVGGDDNAMFFTRK